MADPTGRDEYIDKYLDEQKIENLVFVITRSKNKNVVVYEARVKDEALEEAAPLEVYWLDCDPEFQAANRKKGKMTDRDEIGMVEARMAYGFSTRLLSAGRHAVDLVALSGVAALKGREMVLELVGGRPRLTGTVSGAPAFVDRIYVNATEPRWGIGLPTVNYINIIGQAADTGAPVLERVDAR